MNEFFKESLNPVKFKTFTMIFYKMIKLWAHLIEKQDLSEHGFLGYMEFNCKTFYF